MPLAVSDKIYSSYLVVIFRVRDDEYSLLLRLPRLDLGSITKGQSFNNHYTINYYSLWIPDRFQKSYIVRTSLVDFWVRDDEYY